MDIPGAVADIGELEFFHNLVGVKGELQILFVSVNQHWYVLQVFLLEEGDQLICALLKSDIVGRINDVNEAVGVLVVVFPVRADLALTADIPNIQLETILGLNEVISQAVN